MNWKVDADVAVKRPSGKTLGLPCEECGQETRHNILTHVSSFWRGGPDDILIWDEYYTVQCAGCRTVSFCHESRNSESVGLDPETDEEFLETTTILYPSRIAGRRQLGEVYDLPNNVRRVYRETYDAIGRGSVVLAGVGLRALVESVCHEKEVTGANLREKIDNLPKMGLATPNGAKILHNLRFMGNKAAHEVKAHSVEHLTTAFEVAEHLLREVFILPGRTW